TRGQHAGNPKTSTRHHAESLPVTAATPAFPSRTRASPSGAAEAAGTPFAGRQLVDLDQVGMLDALDHELGDAIATRDRGGRAIVIDEQHLDLASITAVDQSGRVERGEAVAEGEPRPWQHEARV